MKKVLISVFLGVGMLIGCSQEAAKLPPQMAEPAKPALPEHFYAIKDGMEYGYAPAISTNDKNEGRAASKLLMFNYLGAKGSVHQVMLKNGDIRTVAECEKPCEFAKIYVFSGPRFVSKEILQLDPGAILQLVFADAMRGKLTKLSGNQNGKQVAFWVDGESKKLVVAGAE